MKTSIDKITQKFSSLSIQENSIIKIQKWYRGCIYRIKNLPIFLQTIRKFLTNVNFEFTNINNDGRTNSSIDEDKIINLLIQKFKDRIKIPNIRMWYDFLAFDYNYGWIPINIKTTTTLTNDNTGNLAMCVYSYTDEKLDLYKSYKNGIMSKILFEKLKSKQYNKSYKKDYYFLILNKKDNKDIIINSVKGLTFLTQNINNLPFQVKWNKNRVFTYEKINTKIKLFINCINGPAPSWKEIFISNMKTLNS